MKTLLTVLLFFSFGAIAQENRIQDVFPPHWWQGMKSEKLQLLLHGEKLNELSLRKAPAGVKVIRQFALKNQNWLGLDLELKADLKAGTQIFIFTDAQGKEVLFTYDFKSRKNRQSPYGLDGGDLIYLLMPDRFANGNPKNDKIEGLKEQLVDSKSMLTRHGGDISGMTQQLPYLQELGVTAVWTTPVLFNDQPKWSYHGYAATDHYRVDPRLGTNEEYKNFIKAAHSRDIQVVFDVVFNHIGDGHLIYRDIPDSSWFNVIKTKSRSNFNTIAALNSGSSSSEREKLTRGWFDGHMPDLNQDNPELANFLIQNSLWWVEEAEIDAFRIDTYPYCEQKFLTEWMRAVELEYPGFTVFAEVWIKGVANQAAYARNPNLKEHQNTGLSGVLDFAWYFSASELAAGGNNAAESLYITLSQDRLYQDPNTNVIFAGNHDLPRLYTLVNKDVAKFRMLSTILMTSRGIPHWFYGDEHLLEGNADPLDNVRPGFAYGFTGKSTELTSLQKENEEWFRELANWRKQNSEIFRSGSYQQYPPRNGIFVFSRSSASKTIVVVVNTTKEGRSTALKNILQDYTFKSAKRRNGALLDIAADLKIEPYTAEIIELSH